MADCAIRNLPSEQLFEVRLSLSEIAKFVGDKSPFEPLLKVQYCKKASEVKSIAKRVAEATLSQTSLVTVGLTDPKKISQLYKSKISDRIDKELEAAAKVEANVLARRKESAAKIYAFWLGKRAELREKREL